MSEDEDFVEWARSSFQTIESSLEERDAWRAVAVRLAAALRDAAEAYESERPGYWIEEWQAALAAFDALLGEAEE